MKQNLGLPVRLGMSKLGCKEDICALELPPIMEDLV
jgi:hypothetical protein